MDSGTPLIKKSPPHLHTWAQALVEKGPLYLHFGTGDRHGSLIEFENLVNFVQNVGDDFRRV